LQANLIRLEIGCVSHLWKILSPEAHPFYQFQNKAWSHRRKEALFYCLKFLWRAKHLFVVFLLVDCYAVYPNNDIPSLILCPRRNMTLDNLQWQFCSLVGLNGL